MVSLKATVGNQTLCNLVILSRVPPTPHHFPSPLLALLTHFESLDVKLPESLLDSLD